MGRIKRLKQHCYSVEDVKKAVETVKKGKKSIFAASQSYGVPYATLHSRCKGIYDYDVKKGTKPVLRQTEEKELVKWIFQLSNCGFTVLKEQLLDTVQVIIKNSERPSPFNGGRPSRHWYEAFLRRNPEVSEIMSQSLKTRANVSEKSIQDWCKKVGSHLNYKNLLNIESSRIFNLAELSFMLNPKNGRVLMQKGWKTVHSSSESDKECFTALIGGNAAGSLLPPMIIYDYERIPKKMADNVPDGFVIGKSASQWMTTETAHLYISNYFYPWCVEQKLKFPVILYVDGRCSYLTKSLSDFCCEKKIELIGLIANKTHAHLPTNLGLFHPLERSYKNQNKIWRRKNDEQYLTKIDFPMVLKTSLDSLDFKSIFKTFFTDCGLHPFSPDSTECKLVSGSCEGLSENLSANDDGFEVTPLNKMLIFIESLINPRTLEEFKQNRNSSWTGDIKSTDLYDFWVKFKNSCNNRVQNEQEIIETKNMPTDLDTTQHGDTIYEQSNNKNLNSTPRNKMQMESGAKSSCKNSLPQDTPSESKQIVTLLHSNERVNLSTTETDLFSDEQQGQLKNKTYRVDSNNIKNLIVSNSSNKKLIIKVYPIS